MCCIASALWKQALRRPSYLWWIIANVLIPIAAHGQLADSVGSLRRGPIKVLVGAEGICKQTPGGRLLMLNSLGQEGNVLISPVSWGSRQPGERQFRRSVISPVSWGSQYNRRDSSLRISANPLLTLAALLSEALIQGESDGGLAFLFELPQIWSNVTIQGPLVPGYLDLSIAQRTDYYLFYRDSRIYTEVSAGLRFYLDNVGGEVRYVWPLSRGYLEDKGGTIGLSLYWAGRDGARAR